MGFVRIPVGLVRQRDACVTALVHASRDNAALFAVIDLAASTDAAYWHRNLTRMESARSLFDHQPESSAAMQAPWLVRLPRSETDDVFVRRTMDEALAAQNVSWIASSLPLDALHARLSRRLTAHIAQGGALFRYYDARLLRAWWASLTAAEKGTFGAFGSRWCALDPDDVLQTLGLPGVSPDDPIQPPWHVSDAQYDALTATAERHQLVAFLGKRQPDAFLGMSRGERWRFVCMCDAAAQGHGVAHLADRLRYCELALQQGNDFAERSQWQRVWAVLQSNRAIRLDAAIERIRPFKEVTVA